MFSTDELCSLRWDSTRQTVEIIDQTLLPHTLRWCHLDSLDAFCHAITSMQVRGAPLIGITAAYGLAHALRLDPSSENLEHARATLWATRPTAVNLHWALQQVVREVAALPPEDRAHRALDCAQRLREEDIVTCAQIGERGLQLLQALAYWFAASLASTISTLSSTASIDLPRCRAINCTSLSTRSIFLAPAKIARAALDGLSRPIAALAYFSNGT